MTPAKLLFINTEKLLLKSSFLLLLFFTSCSWVKEKVKKGEQWPAEGVSGRQVLGCKINGRTFIVDNNNYSGNRPPLRFFNYPMPQDVGEIQLAGFDQDVPEEQVERLIFECKKGASMGYKPLSDTSQFYVFLCLNSNRRYSCLWSTANDTLIGRDSLSHIQGFINITRYTDANIAGTFAFKAWRDGDANYRIDTIHVSEGRFDY
jgi:hypothetical protein